MEFLVLNVTEALAPSNNPLVNPTARKAFTKSKGRSAVRGTRNLVEDMRHAPRIPTMVDPDSFEVGKDLAISPGEVVFRDEMFELIQYYPTTETVVDYPVVVVPPVINKYYAIDLAPGKSMVEYLVGRGQQPFVISWRNPSAGTSELGVRRLRCGHHPGHGCRPCHQRRRQGESLLHLFRRHHRGDGVVPPSGYVPVSGRRGSPWRWQPCWIRLPPAWLVRH